MTATRDPDRILRAWLELMPAEAPDRAIHAVLDAVEVTPQRRPILPASWRVPPMLSKLALPGAIAVLVLVAGAIALLPRSNPGVGTSPGPDLSSPSSSSSSSGSTGPSATPLVSGLGRGMGYAMPAPDVIREATWVADAPAVAGLPSSNHVRLVTSPNGNSLSLFYDRAGSTMGSQPVTSAAEMFGLVALTKSAGCEVGDHGEYQFTVSADHLTLELTATSDTCANRRLILDRTWVRSFDQPNPGGPGVVTAFEPAFRIDLPNRAWTSITHVDALEMQSPDLNIYAFKDPQGFTEPCTETGGARKPVAQGLDAFEAYVRGLPGFHVTATDETIGGYPARHLAITTTPTSDCPRGSTIVEQQPKAEPGTLHWILGMGDPDSMDVVELPDATILFQLIDQTPTHVDPKPILDSIRFVDSLSATAPPAP
jgi:hypothetical protein